MNEWERIELQDTEWPFTYTDHDRRIVRAIVFDEVGYFYFVRAERNDEFGPATLIETSGGGVEPGEPLDVAIRRELQEELGAAVEIVGELGIVSDYYNLIHRHNINHYFLCRAVSFGEKHLTPDEVDCFHLSTLRLRYDEAVQDYVRHRDSPLGRLVANRELPILKRAGEIVRQLLGKPLCTASIAALARLRAGNEAYRQNERNPAPLTGAIRLKTAAEGQQPWAVIVSCADSRVPPEHVFSAGIGELFVIRNAGNVISPTALASVEYAVGHLHVPLVLVLGHRGCGAVAAALSGHAEPGALGELIAQVRANVETAMDAEAAEEANVQSALSAPQRSPLLRAALEDGRVELCAAIYNLPTGEVRFC